MPEQAQPVNHVLLVDDDGVTLKAVEMLLRKFGWTVTTAAGGKEALKAMEASKAPGARPIDLVLTDLLMPDVDGLQLLSEAGEVPVVVMSSADSQEDVLNCLQKGAADYLIKVSSLEAIGTRHSTVVDGCWKGTEHLFHSGFYAHYLPTMPCSLCAGMRWPRCGSTCGVPTVTRCLHRHLHYSPSQLSRTGPAGIRATQGRQTTTTSQALVVTLAQGMCREPVG
jgi:CheY-like chemotaxis protein